LLRDFWRSHFFSSQYLYADKPYPGAIEYVQELHKQGVEIYYLTGRDSLNMKAGSLASLRQHQLPLVCEPHLHMKPQKGSFEDEEFKDIKILKIRNELPDRKIWFFENEPVILNKLISSNHPIELIWVDTVHSGIETAPLHLPTVRPPWNKD